MTDGKYIVESSELAQKLIDELLATDPNHATFEQAGIDGCHEIVEDLIHHGLVNLALEHLLYVIHESYISYPRERMLHLHKIAGDRVVKNCYSRENAVNLTAEQIKMMYNKP